MSYRWSGSRSRWGVRRLWPGVVAAFAAAVPGEALPADKPRAAAEFSMTGTAVPGMASYDRIIGDLMKKWDVPGGAIAVAKDGRLLLARGYGLADVETQRPVQPDSLFRIASVSKPITAATILALVEREQVDLDAKALDVLPKCVPLDGQATDPRFHQITVRQLLQHTAGFDRSVSLDPMLVSPKIAEALGQSTPPDQAGIIRFMLGRRLDFDPGTKYAYSNFGYCLLGRIIEEASGKPYDEAVGELVLKPAGATRMRLARTRREDLLPKEVRYYDPPGTEPVDSIFPQDKDKTPAPYGRYYIEAMDAHGGWLASPVDLVRFVTALDGSRKPALMREETFRRIDTDPMPRISKDRPTYYGLGWAVHRYQTGTNWSHAGALPGTNTLLVRTHHGMVWAALFNSRPDGDAFLGEVDRAMWNAYDQVTDWPDHDLFER